MLDGWYCRSLANQEDGAIKDEPPSDDEPKSEHLVFASQEVYENYAESPDVNFVNLVIRGRRVRIGKPLASDEGNMTQTVIKQMLQEAPHTIVAQILPAAQCQPNCLYVQVGIQL